MAQDSISLATPQFEIGKVIGTSIAVLGRNLVPFFVIAVVVGIPSILVDLWSGASLDAETIQQTGSLPPGFWGMVVVGILIQMLTYALVQSAIIYGTFQDLRGQKASFGDCLGRGLAVLPRVILGALLASLGTMLGGLLLVIPGIILLVMWWVYIPALVIEGAGITQSFGRSRELTRGHRWGIFGLLLLVGIVQGIVSFILGTLGAMAGPTAVEVLNLAVTLVFSAFFSVMVAVGYYYLRAEKEGIVIDDIAKIFD